MQGVPAGLEGPAGRAVIAVLGCRECRVERDVAAHGDEMAEHRAGQSAHDETALGGGPAVDRYDEGGDREGDHPEEEDEEQRPRHLLVEAAHRGGELVVRQRLEAGHDPDHEAHQEAGVEAGGEGGEREQQGGHAPHHGVVGWACGAISARPTPAPAPLSALRPPRLAALRDLPAVSPSPAFLLRPRRPIRCRP